MSVRRAIEQVKQALLDSHFDIVSISEECLELRGHNRRNLAILPTLMYGILPLVGVIYFWNKKGAEIIVGLCALLFIIVLVVRVISLVNTTKSYLVYDHSSGRLSFRNALVEHDGIDIPDIESIRTSITLITNSRHAHKKWYVANVDLISSEDAKYTVAQFEDGTPYGPTRQAQALARLLAAYFTRPYKHTDEVQIV